MDSVHQVLSCSLSARRELKERLHKKTFVTYEGRYSHERSGGPFFA